VSYSGSQRVGVQLEFQPGSNGYEEKQKRKKRSGARAGVSILSEGG